MSRSLKTSRSTLSSLKSHESQNSGPGCSTQCPCGAAPSPVGTCVSPPWPSGPSSPSARWRLVSKPLLSSHRSQYPPPSLTFALHGSLRQVCHGQEEGRGWAGEGDEYLRRLGGGRDHGVQTQLGRVIRDLACRAAWSCGRV